MLKKLGYFNLNQDVTQTLRNQQCINYFLRVAKTVFCSHSASLSEAPVPVRRFKALHLGGSTRMTKISRNSSTMLKR